jgi:hypothetical protein
MRPPTKDRLLIAIGIFGLIGFLYLYAVKLFGSFGMIAGTWMTLGGILLVISGWRKIHKEQCHGNTKYKQNVLPDCQDRRIGHFLARGRPVKSGRGDIISGLVFHLRRGPQPVSLSVFRAIGHSLFFYPGFSIR